MNDKYKALVVAFLGMCLAVILLVSLLLSYTRTDDIQKVDVGGVIGILIASLIYWFIFTRVWCVSYNLASMWPRLAFRYALGGGIFFALFQHFINSEIPTMDMYYPLLILSLIFGNYCFIFLEISQMGNHTCLIRIQDL